MRSTIEKRVDFPTKNVRHLDVNIQMIELHQQTALK